jgi:hypothetical protein
MTKNKTMDIPRTAPTDKDDDVGDDADIISSFPARSNNSTLT